MIKKTIYLLLLLLAQSSFTAAAATPPSWGIPRLTTAPVIDGIVNEDEWGNAAALTGFQLFPTFGSGFSPLQTYCRLGWDDRFLYISFRSQHPYRELLLVNVRGRDAAVYCDEAFEFHVWKPDNSCYFTYIIGLAALFDAKFGNPAWNSGGIITNISQHDNLFEAEMAIPWADMEIVPQKGLNLGAVLAHDSLVGTPATTNWHAATSGSFYDRPLAGTLTLTEDLPTARLLDWGEINRGEIRPYLELFNPSATEQTVEYTITAGKDISEADADFYAAETVTLTPGMRKTVAPEWPILRADLNTARITVKSADITLAELSFPFEFKPELRTQLACYPSRNLLEIKVDASSLRNSGMPETVSVTVHGGNQEIKIPPQTLDSKQCTTVYFDFSELNTDTYLLELAVRDGNGTLLSENSTSWEKPDTNPFWKTEPVAAARRVPDKFKALEVDGDLQIKPWNRIYNYAGAYFPRQIISAEKELLAEPMKLSGRINGRDFTAADGEIKLLRQDGACAAFYAEDTLPDALLQVTGEVEFDGMALINVTITPTGEENISLNSLQLNIPMNANTATLTHWNDFISGWSGATPENWNGSFRPFIWLGNESAGLYWFAESAGNWNNSNIENQMHISRNGDITDLTINFIDVAVTLTEPITFTFGFAATPTKELPENWLAPPNLSFDPWWDESNQFLHEAVPYEKWRQAVEHAHANGYYQLKYTQTNYLSFYGALSQEEAAAQKRPGNKYFDTPEKKFWGNEWEMWPRRGLAGKANIFCTNTPWRDLVVAGLYERLKESGADGIYFDCAMPRSCNNSLHNCSGGFDILGQRDIRRRLYNIFDQLNITPGIVYEHSSGTIPGPVMSFATYHYDGEQFSDFVTDYRDKISLERLRAFSIGSNWGHIPVFMAFCRGGDGPTESLMALWTLHMPMHFVTNWLAGPGIEARELDKEFDFDAQSWRLGYWENINIIGNQTDTLKATVYGKPGKLFLVVSNLSDETVQAELPVDMNALGMDPERTVLTKSLTCQADAPVWADGVYKIELKPASCMMSIFTEEK